MANMSNNPNGYNHFKNEHDVPQVMVQQPYTATPVVPSTTFMVDSTQSYNVKWSWCHLVTSVIGLFCCTIFGVIAVVSSLMSYADHKVKDFDRSRNKRNVAYGFGIAAIVTGCIGIIIVIAVLATTITTAAAEAAQDYNPYDNNGYSG